MRLYATILVLGGLVGAASLAQAQDLPPGPLEKAQDAFGEIVGANFKAYDPAIQATDPATPRAVGATIGAAARTSLLVPGSVFAGIMKPFADADAGANPAPAPAVAPRRHRRAAVRHRHMPTTG